MKYLKLSLILILSLTFNSIAQNFQGKATYQTKIKVDEAVQKRLDTLKIDNDRKAFMEKMMKRMMEKTYELSFDKTASIYKEEELLAQPNEGRHFRGFSEGILYKNAKENNYTKQKEVFGKVFLIKDDLKKLDWKLEKESKKIGNHLCFKATAMKVVKAQGVNRWRRFARGKKEDKIKNDSIKKEPKLTEVVAWYTPEIPINQGPADYYGLPGLILEVNAGNQIILCNKIVMNPKDKITIEAPKKGKVVSQKEYDEITKKKIEEMREQFKNNRKKGDNGGFRRHRG